MNTYQERKAKERQDVIDNLEEAFNFFKGKLSGYGFEETTGYGKTKFMLVNRIGNTRIDVEFKLHNASGYGRYHGRVHLSCWSSREGWTNVKDGKDYSSFINDKVLPLVERVTGVEERESKEEEIRSVAREVIRQNVGWGSGVYARTLKGKPAINVQKTFAINDKEGFEDKLVALVELIKNSSGGHLRLTLDVELENVEAVKNYIDIAG